MWQIPLFWNCIPPAFHHFLPIYLAVLFMPPVCFALNFLFLNCIYYSFLIGPLPLFAETKQVSSSFLKNSVKSTYIGPMLVFRGLTSTLPCDWYLSICFSIWDEKDSPSWLWPVWSLFICRWLLFYFSLCRNLLWFLRFMMVCLDMGLIPLKSDFSLMLKIICNFFDNFILSTVFISLLNYWTF